MWSLGRFHGFSLWSFFSPWILKDGGVGKLEVAFPEDFRQQLQLPCFWKCQWSLFPWGCWPPEMARGVSVKQSSTSNHRRKMGTFKGKMEPLKETREVCKPITRGTTLLRMRIFCMSDSSLFGPSGGAISREGWHGWHGPTWGEREELRSSWTSLWIQCCHWSTCSKKTVQQRNS